jgi:HpcH/HpaI aldolase/citrate lyase family
MAYEINELLRNHVKEQLGRGEVVASMTVRLIRSTPPARSASPRSRRESRLSQADAIAAVEGVDLVMIGSNDLLADWGLAGQYEHSRLRDAYARTIAACRKHGKHVGVGGLASRPCSPPNSCAWARAMSRPGPISASCWPPAPPKPRRCTTSRSVPYRDKDVTKWSQWKAF